MHSEKSSRSLWITQTDRHLGSIWSREKFADEHPSWVSGKGKKRRYTGKWHTKRLWIVSKDVMLHYARRYSATTFNCDGVNDGVCKSQTRAKKHRMPQNRT